MVPDRLGHNVVRLARQRRGLAWLQLLDASAVSERTWTSIPAASMSAIRRIPRSSNWSTRSGMPIDSPPSVWDFPGLLHEGWGREVFLECDGSHEQSPQTDVPLNRLAAPMPLIGT